MPRADEFAATLAELRAISASPKVGFRNPVSTTGISTVLQAKGERARSNDFQL